VGFEALNSFNYKIPASLIFCPLLQIGFFPVLGNLLAAWGNLSAYIA
jgi:hypothetical protein